MNPVLDEAVESDADEARRLNLEAKQCRFKVKESKKEMSIIEDKIKNARKNVAAVKLLKKSL